MSNESGMAYGCLFCITGKEQVVVERMERLCPEIRVVIAKREKYMSQNGRKTRVEEIILPGYVFFEAPREINPRGYFPKEGIVRVLAKERGKWQLTGEDERFASFLFQYDGLLSFSKAYKEGERIRIVSGPLKDMGGQIKKVDKRGRGGQIELKFDDRIFQIWLGFELIETGG